ncbi:hypothetical protein ACFY2M_19425 [Streptomyces sp. NPDC001276]|uniref:hypothetical protein n=1 Tax=Streptomyces sp. NPDC001276 TaxID=3364555 RepID=UPI0036A375CB
MQMYELEAWLGDDHGLTDGQLTELLAQAGEIEVRYPDPDDQAERDAALSVAYRLMTEPAEAVVADYAAQLATARASEAAALVALQHAARTLVPAGEMSEAGFADKAGVDRMTVRRRWLNKR